jgi:hypothetical protein
MYAAFAMQIEREKNEENNNNNNNNNKKTKKKNYSNSNKAHEDVFGSGSTRLLAKLKELKKRFPRDSSVHHHLKFPMLGQCESPAANALCVALLFGDTSCCLSPECGLTLDEPLFFWLHTMSDKASRVFFIWASEIADAPLLPGLPPTSSPLCATLYSLLLDDADVLWISIAELGAFGSDIKTLKAAVIKLGLFASLSEHYDIMVHPDGEYTFRHTFGRPQEPGTSRILNSYVFTKFWQNPLKGGSFTLDSKLKLKQGNRKPRRLLQQDIDGREEFIAAFTLASEVNVSLN